MRVDQDYDIIIDSGKTEKTYWKDIWSYKSLIYIFVWRDLKVRYKQTFLGVLWSLLRPLMTMFVFVLVFSKIANLPTEGEAPYPILVFTALLPWQFFANALSESSNSLIANQNLITKVYFPRLILPISSITTCLVDLCISFFLLLILMGFYGYLPSWRIIILPCLIIWIYLLTVGLSLFFSSWNIKYRDFRYIIPFLIQLGLFISPVGFSSNIIPDNWRHIYSLNPLVGIIDTFRWSVIADAIPPDLFSICFSLSGTVLILLIGIYVFRKTELSMADII